MSAQGTGIIAADWPAPANVHAFTTTMTYGNLADHIECDPLDVASNRDKLSQNQAIPTPINWLTQVHGNNSIALPTNQRKPKADASFTQRANTVCAVLTADCLPLLLCNTQGSEVAAIHAGWRGLMNGVIDATVTAMHSTNSEIIAWLGPAIGPNVFELNADIKADFIATTPNYANAFTTHEDKRITANIYQLARICLANLGIHRIFGGNHCTYSQQDLFYSYRRQGDSSGRIASIIWYS